jgi:hypothetical protein
MDNDKIETLLSTLSPEEIDRLFVLLQKSSVTTRNTRKKKRRGKGKRKRRQREEARSAEHASPEKGGFLDGLGLTPTEKEELSEASDSDKKAGRDQPLEHPRKTRRAAPLVEARCRVCGTSSLVSSSLVPLESERFKCNKCACSAG